MTQDQLLLTILVVVVLANVVLLASIPVRARRLRASMHEVRQNSRSRTAPRRHDDAGSPEDARAIAAVEEFVAGVSSGASGRGRPPAAFDASVRGREPATGAESAPAEVSDAIRWSRSIREESARLTRYGHPATVVMAELPQLDVLADHFGRGLADQVATEAVRVLASDTREADRFARLGDGRFVVLLVETGEMAASGYVERVRAAVDHGLESSGLSMRLSLGWASLADGGDVMAAVAAAEQRMYDADRRSAPEG